MSHGYSRRHTPILKTPRWIFTLMFQEELIQASIVSNLPVSRAVISAVFYAGRIQPGVAFRTADDVWLGNRQDEFAIAPDATGVKRGGLCKDTPYLSCPLAPSPSVMERGKRCWRILHAQSSLFESSMKRCNTCLPRK